MTPFVWMFIKTYEALRKYIIDTKSITTLVQMEYSAFEEATVPICSFVLKNGKATGKSLCFRLSEFKGGMEVQKQKVLEALARKNCGYFYESVQSNFSKIPGSPIAYWVSKGIMDSFVYGELLGNIAEIVTGMSTGDNNSYLRFWHEISEKNISIYSDKMEEIDLVKTPWIPYNKGGEARKWYGNNDYVVKWKESEKFHRPRPTFSHLYLKKGINWSFVTSGMYSARYYPNGFLWDVAGSPCVITNEKLMYYVLGFLSTKIANQILKIINPTINCQVVDMQNTPILINEEKMDDVQLISQHSVDVSKEDWDAFETSWDFKKHPLLCYSSDKVSIAFEIWSKECDERFNQLKANEEELNRIFIEIYGLQDELTPEVEDKDVTVRQADLQRDIKSLISYAVGCMFGRYSLDEDGLVYAGGEWGNSKYDTFIPDEDNCIPITDEEYFEDDIVGLFCAWLKKVYGEGTLEENLDFIANALGNKGKTSREVIRNYFLTDFIKDHIKTYQKRPIYWIFDSGKQNGFKALVYMHRWNADTIGNVRVEYLHRIQRVYEKEITRMQEIIDNSHDNKEISNATKRKEKLQKQIKETKDYDAKIAHLALSRIDIDLDDGVKVNYEKVQTADGKKMQILAKIS